MWALAFPGQGSQTPGFLTPWLEFLPQLDLYSSILDLDLATVGCCADMQTLQKTTNVQPLLTALGIAVAEKLPLPNVVAGHSVGEIAAAYTAKIWDAESALQFVQVRAKGMQAASDLYRSGMTAVMFREIQPVLEAAAVAKVQVANFNGPKQVVLAGLQESLQQINLPPRTRQVPLSVAGAFHTDLMHSAQISLAVFTQTITPNDACIPVVLNGEGKPEQCGKKILRSLVNQVTRPVRWDLCMKSMSQLGVTGVLVAPPSHNLSGLVKHGMPGVEIMAWEHPDQWDKVQQFCCTHSNT